MTPICELYNGITTWRWLCGRHQSDRRGAGWTVKPLDRFAPWPCSDCLSEAQAAPGYATPTPRFAPTRPESRLPSVSECPRGEVPEIWEACLERLRGGKE